MVFGITEKLFNLQGAIAHSAFKFSSAYGKGFWHSFKLSHCNSISAFLRDAMQKILTFKIPIEILSCPQLAHSPEYQCDLLPREDE